MNITDLLGNIKPIADNTVSSKILLKTEMKKLERRADDMAEEVLRYIVSESEYINRGLSYGNEPGRISEEDKKELLKKLEEVCKQIPSKIKEALDDVFGSNSDNEKKESETKDEPKEKEEIKVVATEPVAPVGISSVFGY